jgi:hypothetical protein
MKACLSVTDASAARYGTHLGMSGFLSRKPRQRRNVRLSAAAIAHHESGQKPRIKIKVVVL